MPTRPFTHPPVDESFFETAPNRLRGTFDVARPAAEVWAEQTAEKPLGWCRILQDVSWTSERPFGVGTTRTARALWGTTVLDERYFIWDEGRRKCFHVARSTSPLFIRFAEDYLIEPTGNDSCRFTWTIAYEPRPAAKLAEPVNKRILGTLLVDTATHYGLR